MKSFFRLILLALVLLVVALVSALTAMRLAIHGHEVAVPDLVGKSPAAARMIAEQSGLEINVERQYYSPSVAEGKILSQLPPAGSQVRRGWQVRVAESLGPQRVEIPNVTGQSERIANINILRRGLDVGAIAQMRLPDAPEGQVLSQAPPPNASGVSAPKISLLLAEPPLPQALVMPSFIGQPLGSVTLALQDAGLRLGTVTPAASSESSSPATLLVPPASAPSPASVIVSQNPAAGEKVTVGAAISFTVR
jgi:beta-lactam-binding protein with PASTA domain